MHTALVETRTFAAQPTAVRRAVLSPAEVADWLSAALCEIADTLRQRGIMPNGFPFARHHPAPGGQITVEAGFPVGLSVATDGTTQASSLPAGSAAVMTYRGPYDKIGTAYDLIADWLRRRGARPAADAWEIYHTPPIGHPDSWRIEIVQPYCPSLGDN